MIMLALFILFSVFASQHRQVMIQSPISINELMPSNDNFFHDLYGNDSDWIELKNTSTQPLDISELYFSDDPLDLRKCQIPYGKPETVLQPHDLIILWADGDTTLGPLHLDLKLARDGETFYVSDEDGNILDELSWSGLETNVSIGKSDDMEDLVIFENATPGMPNLPILEAEVSFSHSTGFYDGPFELSISPTEGKIKYTTDGSPPSFNGLDYLDPIYVDKTTAITVSVFREGFNPSKPLSQTFIVGSDHQLPVVSIVTDPNNLWSGDKGIFVRGHNGLPGSQHNYSANWNRDWEHPATIEFLMEDSLITSTVGVEISGQSSRINHQKSLKLKWRSRFGQEAIEYPFFADKSITQFSDLVLRNGGNNFYKFPFRDAFAHSIISGRMDLDFQSYQPFVVYINGQYWGIQNLRERINENYLRSNHDLAPNPINILENKYDVFRGNRVSYRSILNALLSETNPEKINMIFAKHVDIPAFTNYHVAQLFYGNIDWPLNNVKYWNQPLLTPWRWILTDLDVSMKAGEYKGFNYLHRLLGGDFEFDEQLFLPQISNNTNAIFRSFWKVPVLRENFIGVYQAHLNSTFTNIRTSELLDELVKRVESEKQAHLERWPYLSWDSDLTDLRDFLRDRPESALINLLKVIGEGEIVNIELGSDDINRGSVQVNGVEILKDSSTTINGKFITSSPITLQAIPNDGFIFSHWSGVESNSPLLSIYPSEGLSLKANFSLQLDSPNSKGPLIYPNPVKNSLNLDLISSEIDVPYKIEIIDFTGLSHFEQYFLIKERIEIQLNSLQDGLYLIRIYDVNNHQESQKFLKTSQN